MRHLPSDTILLVVISTLSPAMRFDIVSLTAECLALYFFYNHPCIFFKKELHPGGLLLEKQIILAPLFLRARNKWILFDILMEGIVIV